MALGALHVAEIWEKAVSGSWCDPGYFNQYLTQESVPMRRPVAFDFIVAYIIAWFQSTPPTRFVAFSNGFMSAPVSAIIAEAAAFFKHRGYSVDVWIVSGSVPGTWQWEHSCFFDLSLDYSYKLCVIALTNRCLPGESHPLRHPLWCWRPYSVEFSMNEFHQLSGSVIPLLLARTHFW